MELIRITKENLETEHICCAIANNKDIQVSSKKAWLSDRFDEGLVFLRGDVRGKCFIEYIPAERAWAPISAEGYMYIDCLWVSGQFKGHGYSNILLDECIRESHEKGKHGLLILSSDKKRGFLSDPDFLAYKGFRLADTAEPYFRLFYLPFTDDAPIPIFREHIHKPTFYSQGYTLFYTHQCPFTAKYVPLLEAVAARKNVPLETVLLTYAEQAQGSPAVFSTFSLFKDGRLITHEIQSEKKFESILDGLH